MGSILSKVEELLLVVKKRKVSGDDDDEVELVHIGKSSFKKSDKLVVLEGKD